VRFIVPFGAASASDIARLFADRLAARWGKPVLVENRPGGDSLVHHGRNWSNTGLICTAAGRSGRAVLLV
jgi:hypothetical protein